MALPATRTRGHKAGKQLDVAVDRPGIGVVSGVPDPTHLRQRPRRYHPATRVEELGRPLRPAQVAAAERLIDDADVAGLRRRYEDGAAWVTRCLVEAPWRTGDRGRDYAERALVAAGAPL
jgi:hypothetical protein